MHSTLRHFAIVSTLVSGGQTILKLQQQLRRIHSSHPSILAIQWQDLRKAELRNTSALLS